MPNYRRLRLPAATCFFTVNLWNREQRLLVDHIDALRMAFRSTRRQRPFDLLAAVVLPDHLHCLWTLPEGDDDNATRWRQIKTLFTLSLPPVEPVSASRGDKGERGIWQRRYLERLILDERDLRAHIDYIHYNPVKHGHVERAIDWPHSSVHRYVREGLLAPDWGTSLHRFVPSATPVAG
jgi:putative transposase